MPAPNGGSENRHFKPFSMGGSGYKLALSWSRAGGVKWHLILLLTAIWTVLVHYHERTHVYSTIRKCQWRRWEEWPRGSSPHRIALVADPQIVDDYSYNSSLAAVYFFKKLSDNYLYRNHKFVHAYLDPDTTIFLGDLFDGGREWADDVWFDEYKRFCKIFPKKVNRRTLQSVPGNHDIGFDTVSADVVSRFAAFFGEPNDFLVVGNHLLVLLDTISLSNPDENISRAATQFLHSINSHLNPQLPRILLSHVPLYRNPKTQLCGPLREAKRPFPLQRGKQYQTVIEYGISQTVLELIRPSIIFAGDDHDYCDILQPYVSNGQAHTAREIAVKSAAMTSGIRYPAIQLLSLHNPYDPTPRLESSDTYQTTMCYMPSPYYAIYSYVLMFVFSVGYLALVFVPQTRLRLRASWLSQYRWMPQADHARSYSAFCAHLAIMVAVIYALFAVYFWGV